MRTEKKSGKRTTYESASGDIIDFLADDDLEEGFLLNGTGHRRPPDARSRLERLLERKHLARTISDDLYFADPELD